VPLPHINDTTIDNGRLRLRIYRPHDKANAPILIFFHGGGFVIGSLDTHDALCRRLCLTSLAIIVSVNYALAPENKFPAGLDDCISAIRWVMANARDFGGDPRRVALAGDSAGANLAIVCAIRLREKDGVRFRALLSAYPVTDAPDISRPSYLARGVGFGLTAGAMIWFFNHYLDEPGRSKDPDVAPLRSSGLGGLPPTYLITTEFDPLRDEGIEFAQKLMATGVDVVHVHQDDANHGFLSWAGTNEPSRVALDAACSWLNTRLW
jgi:acetyl esterase